ncbi:hypothetical protein CIT292_07802 [Citrobacter youngae ATCC 29220]|uniref:Uncharacterized protein n=1 Tax=Citrobacter youngae ATCC 29220 TaxID=500640 RepID=D4BBF3_9ENTR|nr:hypothetical protein CIT292_07802 [Citrobacter youngae ATCC 29220]
MPHRCLLIEQLSGGNGLVRLMSGEKLVFIAFSAKLIIMKHSRGDEYFDNPGHDYFIFFNIFGKTKRIHSLYCSHLNMQLSRTGSAF